METVEVKALPFCLSHCISSLALTSRARISLKSIAQLTSTSLNTASWSALPVLQVAILFRYMEITKWKQRELFQCTTGLRNIVTLQDQLICFSGCFILEDKLKITRYNRIISVYHKFINNCMIIGMFFLNSRLPFCLGTKKITKWMQCELFRNNFYGSF